MDDGAGDIDDDGLAAGERARERDVEETEGLIVLGVAGDDGEAWPSGTLAVRVVDKDAGGVACARTRRATGCCELDVAAGDDGALHAGAGDEDPPSTRRRGASMLVGKLQPSHPMAAAPDSLSPPPLPDLSSEPQHQEQDDRPAKRRRVQSEEPGTSGSSSSAPRDADMDSLCALALAPLRGCFQAHCATFRPHRAAPRTHGPHRHSHHAAALASLRSHAGLGP